MSILSSISKVASKVISKAVSVVKTAVSPAKVTLADKSVVNIASTPSKILNFVPIPIPNKVSAAVKPVIKSLTPVATAGVKIASTSAAQKIAAVGVGTLATTYVVNQAIKGFNEKTIGNQLPAVSYDITKTGKNVGGVVAGVLNAGKNLVSENDVIIQNIQDVFSQDTSFETKKGVIERSLKVLGKDALASLPLVVAGGGLAYFLSDKENKTSIPSIPTSNSKDIPPGTIVINNNFPSSVPVDIPLPVGVPAPKDLITPIASNIAPVTASKTKRKHKVYKKSPLYTPFMNRIYNNVNIAVRT